MTAIHWFAIRAFVWMVFATTIVPILQAGTQCPANVDSVRLRQAGPSRIIVPVEINHTGPYDFLLDTGAQVTIVDPSLAVELKLKTQSEANFGGVGFRKHAPLANVEFLKVGSKSVAGRLVLVQDLGSFKTSGLNIRGIIGNNFLGRFNVLIDYAHRLLCLDDTGQMQSAVKGEHIELAAMPQAADELPGAMPLIVPVRFPGAGTRPVLLKLDSGTNVTFLFDPDKCLALGLQKVSRAHGNSADGTQRAFLFLPPQDMQIGKHILPLVALVRLAGNGQNVPAYEVDGLLTTGLFRCIYISYTDRFVILDSW